MYAWHSLDNLLDSKCEFIMSNVLKSDLTSNFIASVPQNLS